jgi:hypothetical protein
MDIQAKAEAVSRLYENKDFQEIVLNDFINQDIVDIVLRENVSSEAVQSELKARKILINYFYDIINQAEMLRNEIKDN